MRRGENWRGSGFHADVVTERVLAGLIAIRNAERGGTARAFKDHENAVAIVAPRKQAA